MFLTIIMLFGYEKVSLAKYMCFCKENKLLLRVKYGEN